MPLLASTRNKAIWPFSRDDHVFSIPNFSIGSSVSLSPAVSIILSTIQFKLISLVIASLVVPGISVTIALFSPDN